MGEKTRKSLDVGRKHARAKKRLVLSARTTPQVKYEMEQVCREEDITKTAFIHRAVLQDLKRRGVLVIGASGRSRMRQGRRPRRAKIR